MTESAEASLPLTGQDQWSRWVLRERFGGDEALRDRFVAYLGPVRDRVLDGASIGPGQTVLDVGCGDGLLGLAALDRIGPTGQVLFSDVSTDLLEHCRTLTAAAGAQSRSRFVPAALPNLAGVPDGAADAVVLRSVLSYVPDKAASLRHLQRVLRPGGRLSLFEPITSFSAPEPPVEYDGSGYRMIVGWLQVVERIDTSGTGHVDVDVFPVFSDLDSPLAALGAFPAGTTPANPDHPTAPGLPRASCSQSRTWLAGGFSPVAGLRWGTSSPSRLVGHATQPMIGSHDEPEA